MGDWIGDECGKDCSHYKDISDLDINESILFDGYCKKFNSYCKANWNCKKVKMFKEETNQGDYI